MAKDETKRLSASVVDADKNAYAALQAINGYAPANPAYTLQAIKTVADRYDAAAREEAQAKAAYDAARDNSVAASWEFHNAMLGASDQVAAQFGRDSNEYQSLGKKKKSEFSSRARRTTKTTT